jgi:hypothetical protein
MINQDAVNFFNKQKFVKIEQFISKETADLLYHHVKLSVTRLDYILTHNIKTGQELHATFGDTQTLLSRDYCCYCDPIFDSLLDLSTRKIKEFTNLDLIPTYTYHRLYTTGTDLARHKDRESCTVSTTLCLGYDVSNVNSSVYPDYNWPMWVKTVNENGEDHNIPIQMNPGDMIIYRGCEVEHWREPFLGKNLAQVFLHFNDVNTQGTENLYDGRPMLGLPFLPMFKK